MYFDTFFDDSEWIRITFYLFDNDEITGVFCLYIIISNNNWEN